MQTDKSSQPLQDALSTVSEFARELHDRPERPEHHAALSRQAAVVLSLNDHERTRYRECLKALGRATYKLPVSDETLRTLLDDLLIHVFACAGNDADQHIATGVSALKQALLAPAKTWHVAYRIQWIASDELPFSYQGVHFVPPDDKMVADALHIRAEHTRLTEAIDEFLPEERAGMAAAIVEVRASDKTSARALALDQIFSAVDELTGLAALFHPLTSPVITDVFNAIRVSLVSVVTDTTEEATIHMPFPLPFDVVHPKLLFKFLHEQMPAHRVEALIGRQAKGDDMTPRLRSALRYIGRAQQCRFENRHDDSFLYFIVAVEALLGNQDYRDSINYQLRMRIAHLIGQSFSERIEIERQVTHLYDVRSKLLHRGMRQVRAADLNEASTYAIRCLIAIIFDRPAKDFSKFAELESWFRSRLLAGGEKEPSPSTKDM
jgi:hypothetical protein